MLCFTIVDIKPTQLEMDGETIIIPIPHPKPNLHPSFGLSKILLEICQHGKNLPYASYSYTVNHYINACSSMSCFSVL